MSTAISILPNGGALCAAGGQATVCAPEAAAAWAMQARQAGHRVWAQEAAQTEGSLGLPVGTLSDPAVLVHSLNQPPLAPHDAGQLAYALDGLASRATPGQASSALIDADTDLVWRVRSAIGIRVATEDAEQLRARLDSDRRAARRRLNVDPSGNRQGTQRWVQRLGVVPREDDGTPALDKRGLPKIGKEYRENASVPPSARELWDAFDTSRRAASGLGKLDEILGATSADGRVHPSFHAVGADTGRMSVSGPAIQNMPREGGVRGILRADEGHLLVTADLKEVEPRLAAILSGDERMKAMLASGRSPYIETAEIIWPGEEVTPERRAIAKTSLLATIYSQQPTGLAPRLGVTVERAAEIQQALRIRYPKLAEWSLGVRHSRGSLTSHFGRSILAPAKGPHARVNYVVQGSAADLFKRMALEVARQLGVASLWLPAHDELAAMVPEADAEQAAETLRHCMTVEIAGVAIFPSDPTTTDRWTK